MVLLLYGRLLLFLCFYIDGWTLLFILLLNGRCTFLDYPADNGFASICFQVYLLSYGRHQYRSFTSLLLYGMLRTIYYILYTTCFAMHYGKRYQKIVYHCCHTACYIIYVLSQEFSVSLLLYGMLHNMCLLYTMDTLMAAVV